MYEVERIRRHDRQVLARQVRSNGCKASGQQRRLQAGQLYQPVDKKTRQNLFLLRQSYQGERAGPCAPIV